MIIIEAKQLVRNFNGLRALDRISFSIEKGEIFGFLGPNGAGKTTTIKILTTLLKPSGGYVHVNGFDPTTQAMEIRKSLGVVFQEPSLDDDLTAYENLDLHGLLYKMPTELRRRRVAEMLMFFELWQRRNDAVKYFSGGMKRRLEIARGLLHHPAILFMDEPTIGLDPQTRNHIWTYLKQLNKEEGITIFFTTHYLEEAEKTASRIAIIDHGRIVAQGTATEIKKQTKRAETLEEAFLILTGHGMREEALLGVSRNHMNWEKQSGQGL